jgi:hypothetical protein
MTRDHSERMYNPFDPSRVSRQRGARRREVEKLLKLGGHLLSSRGKRGICSCIGARNCRSLGSLRSLGMTTLAVLALLATPSEMRGQQSRTLQGIVRDSLSGETIPNAAVSVQNQRASTLTNFDGRFTLLGVPAGAVRRDYRGFAKAAVAVLSDTPADAAGKRAMPVCGVCVSRGLHLESRESRANIAVAATIENPILNSPYEAPARHFRFDEEGKIVPVDAPETEGQRRMAEHYASKSYWYILGTSLAFEAFILLLACWIFVRRDF